jgi:hypothetical protein
MKLAPLVVVVTLGCMLGCSGRPKKAPPATEEQKAAMQKPTVMGPTGPGGKPPSGATIPPK